MTNSNDGIINVGILSAKLKKPKWNIKKERELLLNLWWSCFFFFNNMNQSTVQHNPFDSLVSQLVSSVSRLSYRPGLSEADLTQARPGVGAPGMKKKKTCAGCWDENLSSRCFGETETFSHMSINCVATNIGWTVKLLDVRTVQSVPLSKSNVFFS